MEAFYPTNDGHVGNLQTKSLLQLRDLLARQEKLLSMGSFIKNLPDKGEKVRQFAETLRQLIKTRVETDSPVNQLIETSHDYLKENSSNIEMKETSETDTANEIHLPGTSAKPVSKFKSGRLKEKQNDEQQKKSKMPVCDPCKDSSAEADVSAAFQELSVTGEKKDGMGPESIPKYQLAEQRAKENSTFLREPLKLNSALKINSYEELPEQYKHSPEARGDSCSKPEHIVKRVVLHDYESAATPPKYKYEKAKLIRLSESLDLLQAQKIKQEALQAELASERLAQRLHLKMEPYNPEGVDMSYRSTKGDNLDDSSDSNNDDDLDYGD